MHKHSDNNDGRIFVQPPTCSHPERHKRGRVYLSYWNREKSEWNCSGYYRGENAIYHEKQQYQNGPHEENPLEVLDADIHSFVPIQYNFAKDNNHVYKHHKKQYEVKDPQSFEFILLSTPDGGIYELKYGRDNNHIYLRSADTGDFNIVEGADNESFEIIDHWYAKDKNRVYGNDKAIDELDVQTFTQLTDLYYGDKNGVHDKYKLHTHIDPHTFEQLSYFFSRDKNGVYYKLTDKLDVDLETFELIGDSNYARDKNNVFYYGDIVIGADPDTFKLYPELDRNNNDAYDARSVFASGEWVADNISDEYEGSEMIDIPTPVQDFMNAYLLEKLDNIECWADCRSTDSFEFDIRRSGNDITVFAYAKGTLFYHSPFWAFAEGHSFTYALPRREKDILLGMRAEVQKRFDLNVEGFIWKGDDGSYTQVLKNSEYVYEPFLRGISVDGRYLEVDVSFSYHNDYGRIFDLEENEFISLTYTLRSGEEVSCTDFYGLGQEENEQHDLLCYNAIQKLRNTYNIRSLENMEQIEFAKVITLRNGMVVLVRAGDIIPEQDYANPLLIEVKSPQGGDDMYYIDSPECFLHPLGMYNHPQMSRPLLVYVDTGCYWAGVNIHAVQLPQ